MFGKAKKARVKRKVTVQPVQQPKENTRVLEAENQGLRETVQMLRNKLLDEILRNR